MRQSATLTNRRSVLSVRCFSRIFWPQSRGEPVGESEAFTPPTFIAEYHLRYRIQRMFM